MISIIIPCYNSFQHFDECLQAVFSQEVTIPFEVIVVDSSPTEEVFSFKSSKHPIKIIHSNERLLPGIARNIGVAKALGELLVFIDVDVILLEGALQNAWNYFQNGYLIFNGSLLLHPRAQPYWGCFLEIGFFFNEFQVTRSLCSKRNLASTILFIKKEIFNESRGFKNIPRMQDTEFTERLHSSGYSLWQISDIRALYLQDVSILHVLRKCFIQGHNTFSIRKKQKISNRRRFLSLPLIPFMGIMKTNIIVSRNLRFSRNIKELLSHLLCYPLYMLCGFSWTIGYFKAQLYNRSFLSIR
jgi:glycosyltransferase involved in cell wall biosynthesis